MSDWIPGNPDLSTFFQNVAYCQVEAVQDSLARRPEWALVRDPHGYAPIHVAAFSPAPAVAALLIEHDTEAVHCLSGRGETPLILAVKARNIRCVKILAPKSDLSVIDSKGLTALFAAIQMDRDDFVQALANEESAKQRNSKKQTALIFACEAGFWECAEAVLPFSDLSARDDSGNTALAHAVGQEEWGFADRLAVKLSLEDARHVVARAPEKGQVPRSVAVVERFELQKVASEASSAAKNGSPARAISGAAKKALRV